MAKGLLTKFSINDVSYLYKQAKDGSEGALKWLMDATGLDEADTLRKAENVLAKADRVKPTGDLTPTPVPTNEYRGSHKAPDADYGAPLHDLSPINPDIYDPRYQSDYGIGIPAIDKQAFDAVRKARGKPDAQIPIYRAVPKGVSDINVGDWVTTSEEYAKMHGESALGGVYDILRGKAPAKKLQSEGYPYEFGLLPALGAVAVGLGGSQDAEAGGLMGTMSKIPLEKTSEVVNRRPLVLKNPSRFDAAQLAEDSGQIRGLIDPSSGDMYVMDAYAGMHSNLADMAGLDYDMVRLGSINNNPTHFIHSPSNVKNVQDAFGYADDVALRRDPLEYMRAVNEIASIEKQANELTKAGEKIPDELFTRRRELSRSIRSAALPTATTGAIGYGLLNSNYPPSLGSIEAATNPTLVRVADALDSIELPIIGQPVPNFAEYLRKMGYGDKQTIGGLLGAALDVYGIK